MRQADRLPKLNIRSVEAAQMRAPYLMRRSSAFYFRIRVPADLVDRVGSAELRRALGPMGFHDARALASRLGSKTRKVFVIMRQLDDLTENEVANLIRGCFSELKTRVDRPYELRTQEPWAEREEERDISSEHSQRLLRQIDYGKFESPVADMVQRLANANKIELHSAQADRLRVLSEGVARALVEADRCFQHRLDDGVTPYEPNDPLFASHHRCVSENVGLTLDELIAAYMRAHKDSWRPKTYQTHAPKLKLLSDYLGGDRLVETITRKDFISFPEDLKKLRRNHFTLPASSFHKRLTENSEAQIEASTAKGILARTTGLFSWAFQKGYISTNPAEKLTIIGPKAPKEFRRRRPFKKEEVEKLFSSPMYEGCLSYSRRHDPGNKVIKDDQYWLPILAYYTGARMAELIQLHFSDVCLDHEYPHISITEKGSGKPGNPDFKHVKSKAGIRDVPLHPDLNAMGFRDFVNSQRKAGRSKKRLFFRIGYGSDGLPSTAYSKRFGRMLDKIGLDDEGLVFHSFRHTMMDALRNSGTPKFVVDRIIRHSDPSAAGEYGEGVNLEVLSKAITEVALPLRLPLLLQGT